MQDKNNKNGFIVFTLKQIKRLLVLIIGGTVTIIGVIMLVTPGPAVVVIPIGLGILAIEFVWARNLLTKFKEKAIETKNKVLKKDKDK
jgi:tellurite resistance protein TerC